MTNNKKDYIMQSYQKKYEELKKKALALEYHLDEGITLMTQLSNRINALENAIKEHKFRKEESGGYISDHDEKLWDQLDEGLDNHA